MPAVPRIHRRSVSSTNWGFGVSTAPWYARPGWLLPPRRWSARCTRPFLWVIPQWFSAAWSTHPWTGPYWWTITPMRSFSNHWRGWVATSGPRWVRSARSTASPTDRPNLEHLPPASGPGAKSCIGRTGLFSSGPVVVVRGFLGGRVGGFCAAVDGGLHGGLGDAVGAVEDPLTPLTEVVHVEVDGHVQIVVGVSAPGPADVAQTEPLAVGHDGVLIRITIAVLIAELTHHQRQTRVGEGLQIVHDHRLLLVDAVHVDGKHRVGVGVGGKDIGGVVTHDVLPVLTPVGGIHHQGVVETGLTQTVDRRLGVHRPVLIDLLVVAEGLVTDVDQDVVLLAFHRLLHTQPVVHGRIQVHGLLVLAVAGGVVHLQHADQSVGLAVGNHLGHLLGAVLLPVVTTAEDHSDGVGAQGLDVGQCLGLVCEPGVGMAGTTHDEVVAGGIDQTTVADVKACLGMCWQRVY